MENLNFKKEFPLGDLLKKDILEKEQWILELKNKQGAYYNEISRLSEEEVDNEIKRLTSKIDLWKELLLFLEKFKNSGSRNFNEWVDTLSEAEYIRLGDIKSDYGDERTLNLFNEKFFSNK